MKTQILSRNTDATRPNTSQDRARETIAITAAQIRRQRKLRRQERDERTRGYDLRKAESLDQ